MNKLIDMEYLLSQYLYTTEVWDDGTVCFVRQLMGAIDGVSFHLYANDHNPPHFHIKTKDGRIDASLRIDDCSLLNGTPLSSKDEKRVERFWKDHKHNFEKFWKEKGRENR